MQSTELSFGGKLKNIARSQAARLKQSQATVLLALRGSTRSRFQSQSQNNVAGTGKDRQSFAKLPDGVSTKEVPKKRLHCSK